MHSAPSCACLGCQHHKKGKDTAHKKGKDTAPALQKYGLIVKCTPEEKKMKTSKTMTPSHIKIRGGRVHNLKNIDVDIPLNNIVGIAGVSGSGKSSLALGILYAEGSRRYLEALSTYTRRRMTQAERAQVDEVLYVPAALALRQRPGGAGHKEHFRNRDRAA